MRLAVAGDNHRYQPRRAHVLLPSGVEEQDPQGSKWLRSVLTTGAAHAASRIKGTYLSAQYTRLKGRRGSKSAAG